MPAGAAALGVAAPSLGVPGLPAGPPATPVAVPRAAARSVATSVVARGVPRITDLTASRPRLTVLDQSLFGGPAETGPTTVWSVNVATPDRTVNHQVFVDVAHGAVVLDLDDNSSATPQPHRVVCRPAAGDDHRISNPRCARPSHNS